MTPRITIETIDNLEIDQFIDCILDSFAHEIKQEQEYFSYTEIAESDELRRLAENGQIVGKSPSSINHLEYEPPLCLNTHWQRIKIAA